MNDKDRLIQLIGELRAYEHGGMATVTDEGIADYLLDNGVIVPPVKVGDKVYELVLRDGKPDSYYERIVVGYHHTQENSYGSLSDNEYICVVGRYCHYTRHLNISRIGKTVFLTQEEAEKALKELT